MEAQSNDETSTMETKLFELEGKIERIEEEITKIVKKLEPLEDKPLERRTDDEKEEMKQLRKEKEQLRKKEKQLREEKNQLREEKNLVLRSKLEEQEGGARLPALTAPSKVTPTQIEQRCQSASVLSMKIYLDLIQILISNDAKDPQVGMALINVLRLCDRSTLNGGPLIPGVMAGLFSEDWGARKIECLYSGAMCSMFASHRPRVGEKEAQWLHRVPERTGGEVDIQLCVITAATVWLPVMVLEVGIGLSKDSKHAQASAYAINVSSQMMPNNVLLLVEVIIRPTSGDAFAWLTVTGCHVVTKDRLLARVLLWTGSLTARSFENLLQACDMVAKWNTQQARHPAWHCINTNVAFSESMMYKAFDYRGRPVAKEARRRADLSLQLIQHCERVVVCEDLVVISYPRLEGNHKPTKVGHFICLIESLAHLHERGIVHGDIRASNIIFGANGGATLIDFDFSGDESRKYPKGFNRDIEDGRRARSARPDSNLSFDHDWEALAALMEMACVTDATTLWNNAKSAVQVGESRVALKLLGGQENVSLEFCVDKEDSKGGTGSPPRNQ
jgi:hypothetical protein